MSGARVGRREFMRGRARPALASFLAQARDAVPVEAGPHVLLHIDHARCLGAASQICTVCVERCGAREAIRLEGLLPQVLLDRCTGCGACVPDCPAPLPALRMVARHARGGEHAE